MASGTNSAGGLLNHAFIFCTFALFVSDEKARPPRRLLNITLARACLHVCPRPDKISLGLHESGTREIETGETNLSVDALSLFFPVP